MEDNISIGFHFRTGGNYQYFTLLVTTTGILRGSKNILIYLEMRCHLSTQTQVPDSLINGGSCDESVL